MTKAANFDKSKELAEERRALRNRLDLELVTRPHKDRKKLNVTVRKCRASIRYESLRKFVEEQIKRNLGLAIWIFAR